MLIASDFFLLRSTFAEETKRLLPLPATVDFALVLADGELTPLTVTSLASIKAIRENTAAEADPFMQDDQLVVPLHLSPEEPLAAVIRDVDPGFLRKMSASWLRDMRTTLLQELELVRWGCVDPETELYNRRAASVFFQDPSGAPFSFILLQTIFTRRSAAGNLQKLREIADLLQALVETPCFSFGYGVFGVLLSTPGREQDLETAHFLQHQLKREGMTRVPMGFVRVEAGSDSGGSNVLDRLWRALGIAEKRGPFGLCAIDTLDERIPPLFSLANETLFSAYKTKIRGLTGFSLVMMLRQRSTLSQANKPDQAKNVNPRGGKSSLAYGTLLGFDGPLTLILLPEIDPAKVADQVNALRAQVLRKDAAEENLAVGIASWPCLDFAKSEIPGNCLKALMHGSFLGPGTTVTFDHVSLNISGDAYYDEGDYRAAIREYRRGLRLQPGDANLTNSLGVTLVECGQERQALSCFQQVLAQDPNNYMALVNLGHVRQSLGQHRQALEAFEQAYQAPEADRTAPQELCLPLAKLYLEYGENAKALAVLEHWQSCSGTEREFVLYRLLGQAYLSNNRPYDAIKACQRALQLFPQDSVSLSTLGMLYAEQGEGNDLGLTLCRRALGLDNFNPDHWYRLGRALLHDGAQDAAAHALKQCLQLRHNHVAALLLQGKILALQGKIRQAERCYARAKARPSATLAQIQEANIPLTTLAASTDAQRG